MTNPIDSLVEEHASLIAMSETLEREHAELEKRPNDREAHAAHCARLRQHAAALRTHMARLVAERPRTRLVNSSN